MSHMTRQQLFLAHVMIALISVGSLGCILADQELWPFSNYPMYSTMHSASFTHLLLYGVTTDGEIRLSWSSYWYPLRVLGIQTAFFRMGRFEDVKPRIDAAIRSLAYYYDARRWQNRHHGPPIRGLRLYECSWTLQPWARNRETPENKRLVGEFLFPTGEGEGATTY